MAYIFIFVILLICAIAEVYYQKEWRVQIAIAYYVIAGILVLFSGFREVGFDYDNYHDIFNTVNLSNYSENTIEVGFAFLTQLFNLFHLPFNLFLFFIAMVSIGIKVEFIRRFSPYCFFGLLIYYTGNFWLSDMGQIRHGLAMSIVLLSFVDIFKKNKTGFYFKVFIAYLFHASAILVFPAYVIANIKKISNRQVVVLLALAIPFFFIDLKTSLVQLALYLPAQIQNKIAYYTTDDLIFGASEGFNLTMVLRLVIISAMLFYFEEGEKRIKYYRQIFNLYVYGTLLFVLFNSIGEMAVRFSNYFKLLEFIILPGMISLGRSLFEKHLIILLIILFTAWSIYKMLVGDFSLSYLPYKNVLLSN